VIVLVPSFQPTARLLGVLDGLRAADPALGIVVVDDGSGPEYAPVFAAAAARGAEVLTHTVNRGKGSALKTGFRYVAEAHPHSDVVTADGDGQHTTEDILRVAEQLGSGAALVLGGRRFTGEVPLRSRLGNTVARATFRAATGRRVGDTQTGLRGFRAALLPWLCTVPGDRFEYEFNVLLRSERAGHPVQEIEIETVYVEQNASSHFRPILDSLRVAKPLLAYVAASVASFAVDVAALAALFAVTGELLLSVVGARLLSGTINFLLNRHLVFAEREPRSLRKDALSYAALAAALLAANYGWMAALTTLGVPLLAAKVITEVALYVIGFQVQRRLVFSRSPATTEEEVAGAVPVPALKGVL